MESTTNTANDKPAGQESLHSAGGWFRATRSDEAIELLSASPNAFILSYVIASRARWKSGFNRHGLCPGEAMIGDWENYGMTRQGYRTAKQQLAKWGFATFKTTNEGTIAKLCDARLFDVSNPTANHQFNQRPTNGQPSPNHYSNKGKNRKEGEEGGLPPSLSPSAGKKKEGVAELVKARNRVEKAASDESREDKPDWELIRAYEAEAENIKQQIRDQAPPRPDKPAPAQPVAAKSKTVTELTDAQRAEGAKVFADFRARSARP